MTLPSRNQPLGFAERTRRNLLALEAVASKGEDVHLVTQVATSLLGLVAFPWEKKASTAVNDCSLEQLVKAGWPQWTFSLGTCSTLGDLAHCLRNAISHGRFSFSSESRVLAEVTIEFEDRKPNASAAHWKASIRADHLRTFCLRFITLVNEADQAEIQ